MTRAVRVEAVITAQDKLRPGLSSAARALQRFEKQQSRTINTMGGAAALALHRHEMLAQRAAGIFAGYLGAQQVQESVKRFAEVERGMSRVGITGDATVEQTKEGTQKLREMALAMSLPTDKMIKGMDALTASGKTFHDAMAIMPAVSRTAQASGSEVEDIAKTSTATMEHMGIAIRDLGEAHDIMAAGGKLGQFELKDQARYLPSLLPAARAVGMAGTDGLRKIVAMLQVIRSGSGTAEEAAASASNIFQKMESEETANKFKKMGIDLTKEMAKARKEGKDLVTVFLDLSQQATKGDLSKLPQLFSDMEFARGMRALLTGREKIGEFERAMKNAAGTVESDFKRVISDTQGSLDRLGESFDRAKASAGRFFTILAGGGDGWGTQALQNASKVLDSLNDTIEKGGFKGVVTKFVSDIKSDLAEVGTFRQGMLNDEELASARKERAATVARRDHINAGGFGLRGDNKALALAEIDRQLAAIDQRLANAQSRALLEPIQPGALPADLIYPGGHAFRRADAGERAGSPAEKNRPFGLKPLNKDGSNSGRRYMKDFDAQPPSRNRDFGLNVDVAPLDDAKTRLTEVRTSVDALGPAGQSAGRNLATGFSSGLSQMEADATAAIARIQQKLNTLKAPSLSFSGLNTGRATAGD